MIFHPVPTAFVPSRPCEMHRAHHSLQRHTRRLTHLLFLLFLFSLTSCDNGVAAQRKDGRTYPQLSAIPKTAFNCRGQTAGYYADPETGCQVYHMCDTLQKQYSYLCPNHTLFNQKFMVCDHWYMVNCSSSVTFYELNQHIGEVPDSSEKGGNQANSIGASSKLRTSNVNQDAPLKEVKSTPVMVTLKTPRPVSSTPQTPSNSLTSRPTTGTLRSPASSRPQTPFNSLSASRPTTGTLRSPASSRPQTTFNSQSISRPTTGPKARPQQFTTALVSPLKPTLQSSSPRLSFQSVNSGTSTRQSSNPVPRPRTVPSRFFQLPKVESSFDVKFPPDYKPAPPPSVFLQPPNSRTESTSEFSKSKSETPSKISSISEESNSEEDIPFVQTPRPVTPITMVPGIVARGPGNKFTFTSNRQEKLFTPIEFRDILFRPLAIRPKDKGRKIFTSAPASVTSGHHHSHSVTASDQDTQHSTPTVFAAPLTNNQSADGGETPPSARPNGIRVPSTLLQAPPTVSLNTPPLFPPSQLLPITLKEMKQESVTPLETAFRFESTKINQPFNVAIGAVPNAIHVPFPASRSNRRDFFIPSPELSLPTKELPTVNRISLDELQSSQAHHTEHKEQNMTMVFPKLFDIKLTTLQINPKCPKCHPAFLRPGECTPCVLIR